MKRVGLAACLISLGAPGIALASETITYTYDYQGRVTNVAHSGSINSGVQAAYTYDAADNRTNVTVTGSSNPAPHRPQTPQKPK